MHCVVLDSLKPVHIEAMLSTVQSDQKSEDHSDIARVIFANRRSSSLYRECGYDAAVEGDQLFQYLRKHCREELGEWNRLLAFESAEADIAVELIRLASLSLPFSLEETLDQSWSTAISARLPAGVRSNAILILLGFIFPLYLHRTEPQGNMWKFRIPPICMEAFHTNDFRWFRLLRNTKGDHLELVVKKCIRLLVSDRFFQAVQNQHFRNYFLSRWHLCFGM